MALLKVTQMVVLLLLAGAVVIHARKPSLPWKGKEGFHRGAVPGLKPWKGKGLHRTAILFPKLWEGKGFHRTVSPWPKPWKGKGFHRSLQAAVQEAYDSGVNTGRYLASLDPKAEGWFHSGVEDGRALLSQELEAAAADEYDYEDSTIDQYSY